ncbi:type VI secretion system Vgr family protein [Alloalcanivorax xenomutans]|uniref:type VI secretion system Vgr family protein n=1 Tax=Alloalcanivorax xenomutans TaxID=1094342 RepID=UPI003BAA9B5B
MPPFDELRDLLASALSLKDHRRLYRFSLDDDATPLLVERWCGDEALSAPSVWWVDVLTGNAQCPLGEWLGRKATLFTRLGDGSETPRTGLVEEVTLLGADGGLARYRFTLRPWNWQLSHGRHSQVFQDKSVVDIAGAVFGRYGEWASWRQRDDVAPFLQAVRPRSYCTQYRETDADFVLRLLAEEGLGFRLIEARDAPAGHQLELFSDSRLLPEDATSEAQGGVLVHRGDASEEGDGLHRLGRRRRAGAQRLTLLSEDYKTRQATPVQVTLAAGGERDQPVEQYDSVGQYAWKDADEARHYAELRAAHAESVRDYWQGEGAVRTCRAGTFLRLRQPPQGLAVPEALLLTRVRHLGINNLPATAREQVAHTLGDAPPWPDAQAQAASEQLAERAAQLGYANLFDAQDQGRPWRPRATDEQGRWRGRPVARGYQTARVVGPDGEPRVSGGEEVFSDGLGRVKVRFHWQHGDSEDDRGTCWLRVGQWQAGPGAGVQFVPRIGQEVVVGFIGGDIDRPVVLGALYNGQGEGGIAPTPGGTGARESSTEVFARAHDLAASARANHGGGAAPPWHGASPDAAGHGNAAALWGVQSKEWGGDGYNRLVFDDSDDQLRLQLASSHGDSQLNLGHLIHQAGNYRGSFRGEGLELRTDEWGAVRAERGLWLSAWGREDGDTPAGDVEEAAVLLDHLRQLGRTLSQACARHGTAVLAAAEGSDRSGASWLIDQEAPLNALYTSASTRVTGADCGTALGEAPRHNTSGGNDRVPHSSHALLGLTAPAGIGVLAGQSLTWSSAETLALASGQDSNLAVGGDLRLHSGQSLGLLAAAEGVDGDALTLVSAEGEVRFEAQHERLRVQSRDDLTITSANGPLELAAGESLHLATSAGARLTLEGGDLIVSCPGEIKVEAGKKSFLGGTQLSREMNSWPSSSLSPSQYNEAFKVHFSNGQAAANQRYRLTRKDGAVIEGITNSDGEIDLQQGIGAEVASLTLLGPADQGGSS